MGSPSKKQKTPKRPYRCFTESFVDQPPFSELSYKGKLIYFILMVKLGASGIDLFYEETLTRFTGLSPEDAAEGVRELENCGLLKRDDPIFWLVDSLHQQPTLTLGNEKHRISVERHLSTLPPSDLVTSFAKYHGIEPPLPDRSHEISAKHPNAHQEEGSRTKDEGNSSHIRKASLPRGSENRSDPWDANMEPGEEPEWDPSNLEDLPF